MVIAHWMASAGSWKASRKESPSVAISYPQNLRSASGLEPAHGRHASADRLHAVRLRTSLRRPLHKASSSLVLQPWLG